MGGSTPESVMALAAREESAHIKAISCYSYDRYIDHALDLNVEDDVLELDAFKKTTQFVVTVPSKSHKLIGSNFPAKKKHKLATDRCRKFLSSVIKSVQKNMRAGKYFPRYNSSNVFATRTGRAKFKRVTVVRPGPNTKLVMYDSTWNFLNGLFPKAADIPVDVHHLLNLIRFHPEKEMLFPIHPSLVLEDDKAWSFLFMYEYVKFRASSQHKDLILSKLPYLKEWRQIVYFSDVLVEAFVHHNADYSPLAGMKDGRPTTELEKLIHEGEKFIDLIRNSTAHRLQRNIVVTPAQHQMIHDVLFPRLAPEMQEAIYDVVGEKEFEEKVLKGNNTRFDLEPCELKE